jgi:hypothetical protein
MGRQFQLSWEVNMQGLMQRIQFSFRSNIAKTLCQLENQTPLPLSSFLGHALSLEQLFLHARDRGSLGV